MEPARRPGIRSRWATLAAVLAVLSLAIGLVVSAGCASEEGAKQTNQTMVINMSTPLNTLDPTNVALVTQAGILSGLYTTLTYYDSKPGPDGTIVANTDISHIRPYLAESWTVSPDGKTYTVKLRPGLKFPSGDPLDAAAVKFSFERTIKENISGATVLLENETDPPLIESVSAPDATTVVIKYRRPDPSAPLVWATIGGCIVDPSLVKAHGGVHANTVNEWLASHSAGYGPYVIKSYQPNHQLVLEANPDFFQPAKIKTIIINFVTSEPTLLLQARSGAADVTIGLSNQAVHSLEGNQNCRIIKNISTLSELLNLPETPDIPALQNKTFREALSYAVPYQEILDNIAFGYGQLYYGEWLPGFSWFNPKTGGPRQYDLDKAKQLLKASGVKTPVSFPILVTEGNQVEKQIATAVANVWDQLGVHMSVRTVSPGELLKTIYTTKNAPTMFLDGPFVPTPEYLWSYDIQSGNQFNDLLYSNHKIDQLMRNLPTVTDSQQRQQILDEVQSLWVADSPRIPLYDVQFVTVLSKRVGNFYFVPSYGPANLGTWTLSEN
jgi:peptide/nickel transport system substrate-binding protein